MIKVKEFLKKNRFDMLASFLIPIIIMAIVYYTVGIYWNSKVSILSSDSFSQYANFHASLRNVLLGKENPLYSFNLGMGLNYYAFMSYYLGGIFAPLVIFFSNDNMPNALYVLTLIKIGFGSLSFFIYAKNTFKINRLYTIGLSIAYSLMSFSIAQSEIVMWLDAFVWLPLVILGINRILDYRKPKLLFFSYLILFVSNYYFGFMIGIFTVMYFFARYFADKKNHKDALVPYFVTSILSGLASLIMILPMFLDLRANGETLSEFAIRKTDTTSFWDIVIKNMIGTYDTTQFNSIPFIYIGLIPLIFCIFYFVSRKFDWKHKLGYGLIGAFIIFSFYFVPLDLLWQGGHFPNMFLYRYAFLLSFLVIMLGGYGLEKFSKEDTTTLSLIGLGLLLVYTLAYFVHPASAYKFVKPANFGLTIVFLGIYIILFVMNAFNKQITTKKLAIFIVTLMSIEAATNSYYMIHSLKKDWGFPESVYYQEPRKYIKELVADAKENNNGYFYRLENLDPISTNDSINFQYPGMTLFSSVRNRNSAYFWRELGFKSDYTALNSRYNNNDLLMDDLIGMRYNISATPINKFGFKKIDSNSRYSLYENKYALPLGIQTTNKIFSTKLPKQDNLNSQKNLINALANTDYNFFKLIQPELVSTDAIKYTDNDNGLVTLKAKNKNEVQTITYKVKIPAGKQAYFSLFPTTDTGTGSAQVESDDQPGHWTEIGMTGQYYDLGYFKKPTTLTFKLYLSGVTEFQAINPPVMLLDINNYQKVMTKLQKQGVKFKVDGRKATATVDIKKGNNTIFTSIPYDKGWSAYIDGKKVPITAYHNGVVTFKVPTGKHKIELSFFPSGLKLGIFLFIFGIISFVFYDRYVEGKLRKRHTNKKK